MTSPIFVDAARSASVAERMRSVSSVFSASRSAASFSSTSFFVSAGTLSPRSFSVFSIEYANVSP